MATRVAFDHRFEITDGEERAKTLGMTRSKIYDRVRHTLRQRGLSGGYAVGEPDADDCMCFHYEAPFWTVYFSERGRRSDPSFFTSWMDAAEFFVRKVVGWELAPLLIDWKT